MAKSIGISIYDKPSNSCLASRIPWGQQVTSEQLIRIDLAERFIKNLLGVTQIRVRCIGNTGRIEVLPSDISLISRNKKQIQDYFMLIGFEFMEIDPDGYSTGKLNVVAD